MAVVKSRGSTLLGIYILCSFLTNPGFVVYHYQANNPGAGTARMSLEQAGNGGLFGAIANLTSIPYPSALYQRQHFDIWNDRALRLQCLVVAAISVAIGVLLFARWRYASILAVVHAWASVAYVAVPQLNSDTDLASGALAVGIKAALWSYYFVFSQTFRLAYHSGNGSS